VESLDRRYLEFASRTAAVFSRHPELESLRYFIFRDLVTHPRSYGFRERAKGWMRPFLRRQRSAGLGQKGEILVWIEGQRGILRDTLLPVEQVLSRREAAVRVVSFNGPDGLPRETITFEHPAAWRTPLWAKQAWDELGQVEPALRTSGHERSFLYASANTQSLLNELYRVLDEIQPHLVVAASTQLTGGSALMTAARKRGIRTILVQHGLLQPFYVPLTADIMCTWGRLSSDSLARLDVDVQRLLPLGSPRHDAMAPSSEGMARRVLLESLHLENKPTIVFFSNGNDLLRNGSAPRECAVWLEAVARDHHSRLNIVVRLHPNEDGSLYRYCPHLMITKDRPDFATLLDGCDAVVSLCSTALYEGLLYRKPIWQLAAPGWPDLAENWKQGLARRVVSEEALCQSVEALISGREPELQGDDLVKDVFNNHGRAAEVVADFLQSQIPGKSVWGSGTAPFSLPQARCGSVGV